MARTNCYSDTLRSQDGKKQRKYKRVATPTSGILVCSGCRKLTVDFERDYDHKAQNCTRFITQSTCVRQMTLKHKRMRMHAWYCQMTMRRCTWIGKASISDRRAIIGDPLPIMATIPVFATGKVKFMFSADKLLRTMALVLCSWNPSSGTACNSLRHRLL